MTKSQLERIVQLGLKNKRLDKDEELNKALDLMTEFWNTKIRKSNLGDSKEREECYRMLRSVDDFKAILKGKERDGVKAAQQLLDSVKSTVSRITRKTY